MSIRRINKYDINEDVFSRQVLIEGWNQKTIEKGKVFLAGAGALGNEVVKNLVLAGIGKIYIMDFDYVIKANLNRCILFDLEDAELKIPKVEAIAKNIKKILKNINTEIIPINGNLLEIDENEDFLKEVDIYISCLDNVASRLKLNLLSLINNKPLVDGGMEGFEGYVRVVIPGKTACLECDMNKEVVSERISCSGRMLDNGIVLPLSSVSSTTSIIGGVQSQEVFKLLLDKDNSKLKGLAGKILYYMGSVNYISIVEVDRRKDCICNDFY
ncbi:MAG: ThiF family adenylyltransferase [Thermoproteota archaeon]